MNRQNDLDKPVKTTTKVTVNCAPKLGLNK